MAKKPLTVSYCITCKGRKHHVAQTLRANMDAEKNNPNVEFVLLDYDSRDGLSDYIRKEFAADIASHKLRYAKVEQAPYFQYAHAKNMAHRLATGDILVNLDADNFIAPDSSHWLVRQFQAHPHSIATVLTRTFADEVKQKVQKRLGRYDVPDCASGRIALLHTDFNRLGGYNESFSAWGGEDTDIALRARDAGLHKIAWPRELIGSAIDHSNEERVKLLSAEDAALSRSRFAKPHWTRVREEMLGVLKRYQPVVNDGNVGCGVVTINFTDHQTHIEPLSPVGRTLLGRPVLGESRQSELSHALKADWAATHGARDPQLHGQHI